MSPKIRVPVHHLRPLVARHSGDSHRAATPLELLYDLTLVVAFGVAGSQLAHAIAAGHVWEGVVAFTFVQFASTWAWMSHTWFASAYDNDDWLIRASVFAQMLGVLLLALGTPALFHGFEHGWQMHNELLVIGYVVMRVSMLAMWIRAARANPDRRRVHKLMIINIVVAQSLWTALAFLPMPFIAVVLAGVAIFAAELIVPYVAFKNPDSHPWHPHHLAERYGLLAIIALGEGIIGTVATLEALVSHGGWTKDVVVLLIAGLTLTFGLWWFYFTVPYGLVLEHYRERVRWFTTPHVLLFGAISAVGAGLHAAGYWAEGEAKVSLVMIVLSVVVPTGVYIFATYAISPMLSGTRWRFERLHTFLLILTFIVLAAPVGMAAAGVGLAGCMAVAMFAPWITVIAFETVGHRQVNKNLALLDG